jgi:hypothetical protein
MVLPGHYQMRPLMGLGRTGKEPIMEPAMTAAVVPAVNSATDPDPMTRTMFRLTARSPSRASTGWSSKSPRRPIGNLFPMTTDDRGAAQAGESPSYISEHARVPVSLV